MRPRWLPHYLADYELSVRVRKAGYRLSWMTVPDDAIKAEQVASLAREKEEEARKKENEANRKRAEELQSLEKKKDEQEKKKFKKGQDDLEKALIQAAEQNADAVVAPPDPVTIGGRERLAAWAIERRLPFASGWAMFADSGGLMTYGPSVNGSYRRVGYYAARVLRGAKPADLPIEQPSRFEMVLNLRTAKAIDLKVPDVMIERADRVIE